MRLQTRMIVEEAAVPSLESFHIQQVAGMVFSTTKVLWILCLIYSKRVFQNLNDLLSQALIWCHVTTNDTLTCWVYLLRNMNVYLYFLSFLYAKMPQVVEILPNGQQLTYVTL